MSGQNEQSRESVEQPKATAPGAAATGKISAKTIAQRLGRRGIVIGGLATPTVLTLGVRRVGAKTTKKGSTGSHKSVKTKKK